MDRRQQMAAAAGWDGEMAHDRKELKRRYKAEGSGWWIRPSGSGPGRRPGARERLPGWAAGADRRPGGGRVALVEPSIPAVSDGEVLRVALSSGKAATVTRCWPGQGLYVTELRPDEADLETVFLELTGAPPGQVVHDHAAVGRVAPGAGPTAGPDQRRSGRVRHPGRIHDRDGMPAPWPLS
jgi:hypothetical protein